MRTKKIVVTFVLTAVCIAAVWVGRSVWGPQGRPRLNAEDAARSKGKPSAKHWVVEYIDYQCTACRVATGLLAGVAERHPRDIYLQVRFFPLEKHSHGFESAVYGYCAAKQKKFFEFHELLFSNQDQWSSLPDIGESMKAYAKQAGMDPARLDACVNEPQSKEAVQKEHEDALLLGVVGTPTVFLDGKMTVGVKALAAALNEQFEETRQ